MKVGGVPLDSQIEAMEFLLVEIIKAAADRDPDVVSDVQKAVVTASGEGKLAAGAAALATGILRRLNR